MENEKGIIKLSRKQLYDEIWELSVAGVARKHNLNYAKLIATCKAENLPFPTSGYWTRKNMGKDVSSEVIELPGSDSNEISLLTNEAKMKRVKKSKDAETKVVVSVEKPDLQDSPKEYIQQSKEPIDNWSDGVLEFLNEEERKHVLVTACNLQVNENTRLHKVLVQYKKAVADYRAKLKEAQSRKYYNPRYNKPENEPEFFKEMSDEGMARAIALLATLFKAIEQLGGIINSDFSVRIRSDVVRFRMAEGQDQIRHDITKQEAQELVKYNDSIKHGDYASKPQIRNYDKIYNGKLRIVFGERSYIRDSDSEKLEDRLGDILIALYDKSEENRIVREEREAAERKRAEEARLREEKRQRKELEIQRTKELANKAEDFRIASEIRTYIQAMIGNGNEEVSSEWIEWAKKKANWYDPSVAAEDEYLGKREHEKSREDKEKTLQDSVGKSWYW